MKALRLSNNNERSSLNKSWQEIFDDAMWDFIYGYREKQWNPDRRPKEQQGKPFDYAASKLSWGKCNAYNSMKTEDGQEPADASVENNANFGIISGIIGEKQDKNDPLVQKIDEEMSRLIDYSHIPTDEKLRYLSGLELAELCFSKYENYHDMSVYYADPFGKDQRQVAFNVYGSSLGSPNFPMSEQQYLEKLEYIASMLNAWDQAWYVKEFMMTRPIPRRGLPSKPKWDTAVTLRLNKSPTFKYLKASRIKEYIGTKN